MASLGSAGREDVEGDRESYEWKRPRTPAVRLLWDGRATEAVLEFLRTRVGCIGTESARPEEEEGEDSEGEEGKPGPI